MACWLISSPESIAWCINRIISNPKEMKHLARAGWTRIESEFSWDHIAESTEKVYEQAIEQTTEQKPLSKVAMVMVCFSNFAENFILLFFLIQTERFMKGEHKGLLAPR